MKNVPLALLSILVFTAASGQETVTLPSKPANPRAGRVLGLREVFRISDAGGEFFFKSPKNIKPAPDGGVLVVDEDELLRFDAQGRFVVNMFRPGQGPGELRQVEDYLVGDGGVLALQVNPAKCVLMDLDGKFLRDFKPEVPVSRLISRRGDRLLAAADAFPQFDKVQKPEGDFLDIAWTLKFMSEEGHVESTSLAFPTKWFVKRLAGAMLADFVTFFLSAPLGEGLVAVANEEDYVIRIADPEKGAVVRTIRRDYRRVKYEAEKNAEPQPGGARHLAPPRDHFNDIQKIFAVEGRIWVVTSTLDPAKGVLVDVVGPRGEYIDSFYLPLPKGVGLHALARHALTVADRAIFVLEAHEDGRLEVVKYDILDPGPQGQ